MKFYQAEKDARTAIYEEAKALAASAGETGNYYLRVMGKLYNGTETYVDKETKRFVALFYYRGSGTY